MIIQLPKILEVPELLFPLLLLELLLLPKMFAELLPLLLLKILIPTTSMNII